MNKHIRWIAGILPLAVILTIALYNFVHHGIMDHPGETTYIQHCANCHGPAGEGIQRLIPPLKKSDFAEKNFERIPCYIREGMSDSILVNGIWYCQTMYPISLNSVETANVMNYLNEEMEWEQTPVTSRKVESIWQTCSP